MTITVTVRYHNILRRGAGVAEDTLHLPSTATVVAALDQLATDRAALRSLLFTDQGALESYVVVFRNGKLVPHEQLDAVLADGDQMMLFPAVSGG